MVKIKNTGDSQFQVLDPTQDPRRLVVIPAAGEREVSDELAAHLLKAHPDRLKKAGAATKGAKGGEAAEDGES